MEYEQPPSSKPAVPPVEPLQNIIWEVAVTALVAGLVVGIISLFEHPTWTLIWILIIGLKLDYKLIYKEWELHQAKNPLTGKVD